MEILAVLLPLFYVATATCPTGWLTFEDKCYWFEHYNRLPWNWAMADCKQKQGSLVKIYSARENNFIKSEMKKLNPAPEDQYWTAGQDVQTEKEWMWSGSNDFIVEYLDWYPGEPNSYSFGNEDCLAIYPRQNYQWNDETCIKPLNYICEQSDSSNTSTVAVVG